MHGPPERDGEPLSHGALSGRLRRAWEAIGAALPGPPTHAGGVVARRGEDGTVELLVVSARSKRGKWVLPKGRIEPGESAEEAARREVLEESGVEAAVREPLGDVTLGSSRGRVRVRFYLMEAVREGRSHEGRAVKWCGPKEIVVRLRFKESRRLIRRARARLREMAQAEG